MADIDDIIERLLSDRRISESTTFSTRSYSDQPIIERGSDLKARMERRNAERAAKRQHEAEMRRAERQAQRPRTSDARDLSNSPRAYERRRSGGTTTFVDLLFGSQPKEGALSRAARAIGIDRQEKLPERIRAMRQLEGGGIPTSLAYGSSAAGSLFYRQAKLMEDYEDSYEYHGTFMQYYPTYAAMTDAQLRGYFSWRTGVRAGTVEPAPLSFAFVHVYELLLGVGTTPGHQGLCDLRAFGEAYRAADERQGTQLLSYLRRWEQDYIVYHELYDDMTPPDAHSLPAAALTLLSAEHAQLGGAGRAPRIPNEAAGGPNPSREQLFQALSDAATYHLSEARLAKDEGELVREVACDVFDALVMHCSKRRKTDFVEGLFGYASRSPYTMFSAAVFCEPVPHEDCTVRVSDVESFVCRAGRWSRLLALDAHARNADLGLVLHTVDYELRRQLDYAYPLKERTAPKYLQKIVSDAIASRLAERAEAERRRITIDRSKLRGIRAAAAVTQESLLTDEERAEEVPTEVPAPLPSHVPVPTGMLPHLPEADAIDAPSSPAEVASAPEAPAEADGPLSALEARFLEGLLEGMPATELLSPTDPFPSVVADAINEKLFDLVGDAVIEFDGDEPRIIEDYLDDIREVLHP